MNYYLPPAYQTFVRFLFPPIYEIPHPRDKSLRYERSPGLFVKIQGLHPLGESRVQGQSSLTEREVSSQTSLSQIPWKDGDPKFIHHTAHYRNSGCEKEL
jgi:hypothetical protein